MQTTTRARTGSSIALTLATVLLGNTMAACSAHDDSNDGPARSDAPAATAQVAAHDGETVFRGIFFGQGPVADALPEIWQDPEVRRRIESRDQVPLASVVADLQRGADAFRGAGLDDHARQVERLAADVSKRQEPLPAPASITNLAARQDALLDLIRANDPTFLDRFGADIQSGDHLRVQRALRGAVAAVLRGVEENPSDHAGSVAALPPSYVLAVAGAALVHIVAVIALAVVIIAVLIPSPEQGIQEETLVDHLVTRLAARNVAR